MGGVLIFNIYDLSREVVLSSCARTGIYMAISSLLTHKIQNSHMPSYTASPSTSPSNQTPEGNVDVKETVESGKWATTLSASTFFLRQLPA